MRYKLLTFFAFLFIPFIACKKEDKDKITGDDEVTTGDFSLSYVAYMDAIKTVEDAMDSNYGALFVRTGTPISCSAIEIDSNATLKTYTITYTNDCSDYDGYNRSGKIIAKVSGTTNKEYNVAGAVTEITFDGYNYRHSKLAGTISMTCITPDEFEISINGDLILDQGAGKSINLNTKFLRTTMEGEGDEYLLNNVYEIGPVSGTSSLGSGKNTYGQDFNVTFSANLRQSISCYSSGYGRYPVSGALTFSRSSAESDIKLDFGSGTCDNAATLVRNSTTKSIFY